MTLFSRLRHQAPPPKSVPGRTPEHTPEHIAGQSADTRASTVAAEGEQAPRILDSLEAGAIRDAQLLGKLVIEGESSRIRQLAAEAIQDPEQLRELLKHVRGKDKNVYKIVRQKCDAILAQEKAAAETQAHIESVCAALERHVHSPFDNLFEPTLDHLRGQWGKLAAHAAPEIKTRIEAAIDRCCTIVAKHAESIAAQAARETAIVSADTDRQVLLAELQAALAAIYVNETIAIDGQLDRFAQRWTQIGAYKSPGKADAERYERLRRAVTETAESIARHGSIRRQTELFRDAAFDADLHAQAQAFRKTLAHIGLLDEAVHEAVAALDALQAWEKSRIDKQTVETQALRQIGGLIRAAMSALNNGQSRQAAGMRRTLDQKLQTLANVPEPLTKQLQHLDDKLKELQDWKSYAVAPKRIELIEHMESLIGSHADPNALAERIKQLQEEWKAISKGNTDNTDAEWQRFHLAAQTAFEPCREYFAAQAKLRADNLDKRKALLARLTQFAAAQNWEQPDWREIAKALREARLQWRGHQPVERAANKALQERFDAAINDLQTRLDAECARNATEKQRLIARARGLVAADDSRKAIDEVKRLQSAWKDVGIVARDDDQKLWQEFRQHCDAVFAKRQQQHSEHIAGLDANKSKAIALCEEAERWSALSGSELLEAAKKAPSLREAFDAAGELPRANARELQSRFERALAQCEKNIAQQRARDKAQIWNRLLEAGDKIRAYRLAAIVGAPEDERDALKQAAQSFVDDVQHWPKTALQAIKSALATMGEVDIVANEAALRTLCVRAEILTDTPTPPADQTFRRNYQMRRLTEGLGQARSSNENIEGLMLEWIGVGATANDVHAELLARFNRCRHGV